MSLIKPVFSMLWHAKSKELTKGTQLDKVLRSKVFKTGSDAKYDGKWTS